MKEPSVFPQCKAYGPQKPNADSDRTDSLLTACFIRFFSPHVAQIINDGTLIRCCLNPFQDDLKEEVAVLPAPTAGALPQDHENYNKWFYRDPQGDLQGELGISILLGWAR